MIITSFQRTVSRHIFVPLVPSIAYVLPLCSFYSSFADPTSLCPSPSPEFSQLLCKDRPFVINYLIQTFGVPESRARSCLRQIPRVQTSERPDSVVRLFQQYGFLDSDIRKAVQTTPPILFLDAERILKPKLQFFQELGFTGPQLGLFISKRSTLLTHSLERRLAPSIKILKEFLSSEDLVRVLRRCKWLIKEDPNAKLIPNMTFLRDCCGLSRSQLYMLLVRQPSLFVMDASKLQDIVRKTNAMGFSVNSPMFVYALYTITCMTPETIEKKFELFRSYGFSNDELMQLLRRSPSLFRTSEQKLKSGMEFFLMEVGTDRTELISCPASLMYSMEQRVYPRYRVLRILHSKGLLKKHTRLVSVIQITEEDFLKKYILRFDTEATGLLSAYKMDTLMLPSG